MRIGVNDAQDLLALLVRRKWWVIAPFLGLFGLIAVLTCALPRTYVSEVLVLVRPRDVPQDFVKDLIAGTPEERLKSIEQTLLSRTNLLQILREFGDSLAGFEGLNLDEKVIKIRQQINIFFELEKSNGKTLPLTYFRISYQNQNPELAQKIATRLTELFIEQDNRARENQVFGTTEFLSSELNKVSEQLSRSSERVKQIKSSRQFELPDQRDANLRTLDRLVVDKKSNAEALDRYAAIRLTLESQISQTPETLPVPAAAPAGASPQGNLRLAEYRKAQQELDEASGKYTANHPDVQAAKARLERLRKQIPPEALAAAAEAASDPAAAQSPAESGGHSQPNPLYQKLSLQLDEVKTEIAIREKERVWIESEIAKYTGRVENTPNAEQDISGAVQQNNDLKSQYEVLKNRLTEARLSESLESRQKGAQFVVVDPANYPLTPTKPNKAVVLLAGTVFSFIACIAIAVIVDISRQRIWTQSQIEMFWGVPVLVDIPAILTDSDLAAGRRKKFTVAGAALGGAIAWSFCLYLVYLKHPFILHHLDPLIQRLIYK